MLYEIDNSYLQKGIAVKNGGLCHQIERLTPSLLDGETRNSLIRRLTPLTGMGFMRDDIYADELYRDVEEHVLGAERLVLAILGGEINAFIAAALRTLSTGEVVYHLEGIICHPDYMNTGLAKKMLVDDLSLTHPHLVAFHTQSESMKRLGLKVADLNEQDALRVASLIGTRNQDGIIDRGRYGGKCLYGDVERFGPTAIQGINYLAGDALICAGPVRKDLM